MRFEFIKAIIILPGTVLVFVPALILRLTAGSSMAMAPAEFAGARFWIGLVVGVVGFVIAAWSARLFLTVGEGTPAPLEPVDKIPPAFERRCIQAGSLRSALLLGRIAVLFPSRRALPARRLAALGARAALSTDC